MSPLHTSAGLDALWAFVTESNRIEGIWRNPTGPEIDAHLTLLERPTLRVADLVAFVGVMQPDAVLREKPGLNVRVGNHLPPAGGPWIRADLEGMLEEVNTASDPFASHVFYETLHPFTDGNGRSGRAVWLWQMIHQSDDQWALRRGFLHTFYYQSLAARSTPGQAVTEGDTRDLPPEQSAAGHPVAVDGGKPARERAEGEAEPLNSPAQDRP